MELSSLVIPAIVTPFVLYVAIVAQRHAGPAAGGLVATFPFQSAIAVVGVAGASGALAVADFGMAAAVNLLPQVVYALAFALGMSTGGIARAIIASAIAYPAAVLVAHSAPPVAAEVAGVVALWAGSRFLARRHLAGAQDPSRPRASAVLLVAIGTAVVLAVVTLVEVSGPDTGAFLGAIPVVSTTLAIGLERTRGRIEGAATMSGTVRGLASYNVFALSIGLLTPRMNVGAALLIGLLLSASATWGAWRVSSLAVQALGSPD